MILDDLCIHNESFTDPSEPPNKQKPVESVYKK